MIYKYHDYKSYLKQALSADGVGRGARSRLAAALRCQTGFVSHVLNGKAHFSPEHALVVSRFLNHTSDECKFFLLLVNLGRAGSQDLKSHYRQEIEEIQRRHDPVKDRIKSDFQIPPDVAMICYSTWYFLCIHVATMIPEFRTPRAISTGLGISLPVVQDGLKYLVKHGLVSEKDGQYTSVGVRFHLDKSIPIVSRFHAEWRVRALQSLSLPITSKSPDLHYTTVMALAHKDVSKIREILQRAIVESEGVLEHSKEEVMYSIALDWFRLSHNVT